MTRVSCTFIQKQVNNYNEEKKNYKKKDLEGTTKLILRH